MSKLQLDFRLYLLINTLWEEVVMTEVDEAFARLHHIRADYLQQLILKKGIDMKHAKSALEETITNLNDMEKDSDVHATAANTLSG